MTDTDPADEETMSAPTEAVLEKLQSSPEAGCTYRSPCRRS